MRKIPYIDYNKLAGFYTLQQVAGMLRMNIQELAKKGKQYNIRLYRDDSDRYLLDTPAIKIQDVDIIFFGGINRTISDKRFHPAYYCRKISVSC